jgi:hypothetical protein
MSDDLASMFENSSMKTRTTPNGQKLYDDKIAEVEPYLCAKRAAGEHLTRVISHLKAMLIAALRTVDHVRLTDREVLIADVTYRSQLELLEKIQYRLDSAEAEMLLLLRQGDGEPEPVSPMQAIINLEPGVNDGRSGER